jgi:transposase
LDQAGYHRSEAFLEGAKLHNIELHHLPPYSPNLNPIERLWRVMNQKVRDNVVFNSAKEFRDSIGRFFTHIIPKIRDTLRDTINDNFETLRSTSSG